MSGNPSHGNEDAPVLIDRRTSHTPSIHQQDIGFEWNENHEILLRKWQDRSEHYEKLHNIAGKWFGKLNAWIGLPTKIFLSIIASVEFSQLSSASSAEWMFYFNGLLALVTLALETSQDYLGWAPRSVKHYSAANIYEKLAMNIEMEICNPREKRVNVRAFLRNAKTTLQDLKATAPDIPTHILDAYLKELENTEKVKVSQFVRNVPNNPFPHMPLQMSSPAVSPLPSSPTPPPDVIITVAGGGGDGDGDKNDPETDLQDEFAVEMQRKLQLKKGKNEQFQIQRLNE